MRIHFRVTRRLLEAVLADLRRPHAYAAERVGFLSCGTGPLAEGGLIMLARAYHAVDDSDYLDDSHVGAMVGAGGFRQVLQIAYRSRLSIWHVHLHDHAGRPWFSRTDREEHAQFVPDFWHVRPELPHGALVLSRDTLAGLCWVPGRDQPARVTSLNIVGAPMTMERHTS